MNHFLVASLFILWTFVTFAEPYKVFEEDGKFGLRDEAGVVLIPPMYEGLGWSQGSFSVIDGVTGYLQHEKWGLINIRNEIVTEAQYATLYPAGSGYLVASKRSPLTFRVSTGCIDTSGKIIIPFNFSGINLHSQRAIVYTLDDNKLLYGLIDMSNKTVLPQIYQNIYPVGSLRYAVQDFNGRTALFTENGRSVTGFVIDSISPVNYGLAIFYQNGKQGLINREGQIIKQPIYRDIRLISQTYQLHAPDQWMVMDASHKTLKQIEADSIVPLSPNRVKQVTAMGTQLLDADFNPIGSVQMDEISSIDGSLVIFKRAGKVGVMHLDGHEILPAAFDRILFDKNAILACTRIGGRPACSMYDRLGTLKTKRVFDQILPNINSIYPVHKNGYYGAVDKSGNELLACTFDSIAGALDDLVVVRFRNQFGVINLHEQWVVLPQPNPISLLNAERYFEYSGELRFLKSMDGTIIYFTTNDLEIYDNYLIEHVTGGGKWAINFNGQIVHREQPPNEYAEIIFPSSEGYRAIRRNGRYGFIDDQGRLRIANRYENIKPFSEGLAAVQIRGKWGFINKEDKIVIQPIYEDVGPFEQGKCKVKLNGKIGLIDHQGHVLLDPRYDDLNFLTNKRIIIKTGDHYGLTNEKGDLLLQSKYEYLEDLNNGYVIVKQQGKFGLISLQGITTIPIQYDRLYFEPTRNVYFAMKVGKVEELDAQ